MGDPRPLAARVFARLDSVDRRVRRIERLLDVLLADSLAGHDLNVTLAALSGAQGQAGGLTARIGASAIDRAARMRDALHIVPPESERELGPLLPYDRTEAGGFRCNACGIEVADVKPTPDECSCVCGARSWRSLSVRSIGLERAP